MGDVNKGKASTLKPAKKYTKQRKERTLLVRQRFLRPTVQYCTNAPVFTPWNASHEDWCVPRYMYRRYVSKQHLSQRSSLPLLSLYSGTRKSYLENDENSLKPIFIG
jgi:hypothetical protein